MKPTTHTTSIAAGLVIGALWVAAPAAGSVAEPPAVPPPTAHAQLAADQQGGIVLRRDASQATPFVAGATPQAATTADGDAFDWGDAAIGAGAGLLAVALAIGGSAALGGRRRSTKPVGTVSQGA